MQIVNESEIAPYRSQSDPILVRTVGSPRSNRDSTRQKTAGERVTVNCKSE